MSRKKSDAELQLKKKSVSTNPRVSKGTSLHDSLGTRSRMSLFSVGTAGGGRQSMAWRASGRGGFKVPKFQNSYRLEPHLPFKTSVSDKILAQVMTKSLTDIRYNPTVCPSLAEDIAKEVRDKLYKTDFDRVKYLVVVTIIENGGQAFTTDFGRLWDPTQDAYSTFVFENPTLFATGIALAVYYE